MKRKPGSLFSVLIVFAAVVLALDVQADPLPLTDQQIQELKKQYSIGGNLKSGNDSRKSGIGKAEELSKDQQAVQPRPDYQQQPQQQQQSKSDSQPVVPSAIEASMRARLATDLNIKDVKQGRQGDQGNQNRRTDENSQYRQGDQSNQNLRGDQSNQNWQGDQSSQSDQNDSRSQNSKSPLKRTDNASSNMGQQRDMAESSKNDTELRSSWEHFLENQNEREVNGDISQFGYQLFAASPNTFSPAADIPVPPEYVLGPGDELQMQLYGSRDDTLSLVVDRNGVVELPRVGSLALAGLSFVQAKALIAAHLHKKAIGVTASITMGKLRSIRVFVLGDAEHPGSYLVSGFSTISHALFAAGGVSKTGSLRHIQLKRNGRTVRELDLYDFLLKGNSRDDERLMPGDVVFIPPIGHVIGVAGQATRPAIYELRDEKNVQDVLLIAGGILPDADVTHMQVDRLNKAGDRNILDLKMPDKTDVQNGDILILFAIPGVRADMVSLLGQVKRPGKYGWHKDMKLTSLLATTEDLLPGAFLDYALIQRTDPLTRTVSTLRVPLDKLLVQRIQQADTTLNSGDHIYVFSKSSIDPLNVVAISGQVVNPGQYPYTDSMHLIDLLFAAGGPKESSYLKVAELTRYEVVEGRHRQSSHFEVNLSDALAGDPKADILLKPHDELLIRTISNWRETSRFELTGEIKYPGEYPVEEGERLSGVLQRAGGYTVEAYLRAAMFTRESVRVDQQKQIDDLALRTEAEIIRMEEYAGTLKDEILRTRQQGKLEAARRISEQLKAARATGRIVIELADIEKLKGSPFDLALRDGDKLYIPKRPDEVLVLGEVYNQTAFVYRSGTGRDDYLRMAGGPTRTGDAGRIYVVRANGMVDSGSKGWFGDSIASIEPGDAIVVPQDVEQFNLLDSTLDWSRAVMQIGISLAAMKTIGVFK